jgi:riboflavin kinase/FMN adenylyltransferase
MKVMHGVKKIKKYPNPVVALGVFDGVHLGHKEILRSVVKKARSLQGTSIVVTFWPHPQKEEALYSLEHRLKLIKELRVDVCVIMHFNKKFSRIPAESFIENILIKKLGASHIYIGKNFRFGRGAKGDFSLLQNACAANHFKVRVFDVVKANGKAVSSTTIRGLIRKGDLKGAQRLLSRPVSILGTVIKGVSLGKKIGIPTANIDPHHEVIPPEGVYAVKVILRNKKLSGACYIGPKSGFLFQGPRASFGFAWDSPRPPEPKSISYIEVHIFNFRRNIYGENLEIQFIKKIRNPRRFSSLSALVTQVKRDISNLR